MKNLLRLLGLMLIASSLTFVSCGDDKGKDEPTPPPVNPGGGGGDDPGNTPGGGDDPGNNPGGGSTIGDVNSDEYWASHPNRGSVSSSLSGDGTLSTPYLIRSAADLRFLSDQVRAGATFSGKYFKMTQDIRINSDVLTSSGTMNGSGSNLEQWIPIGRKDRYFQGTFDGNGYTIYGIYCNRDANYLGLFGIIEKGLVRRLTLKDSYIHGTIGAAGGIIADALGKNYTVCENCVNYATVSGYRSGGIVGRQHDADVKKCINYGNIIGTDRAGGITSFNTSSSTGYGIIERCINYGSISGSKGSYIGGISGSGAIVQHCLNKGTVSGGTNTGGIIGWCFGTTASKGCYNNVNIGRVSSDTSAGAIVGSASSSSKDKYSKVHNNLTLDFVVPALIAHQGYAVSISGNRSVSDSEMKSRSILEELNGRGGKWITGNDGYPMPEIN